MTPGAFGVGLQANPTVLEDIGLDRLDSTKFDFLELLCDDYSGPLDGPYVMFPGARESIDKLFQRKPLIAHGNYGADFGFDPVEQTAAVTRHLPIAEYMHSPWYTDHMFYGDLAGSYMWSSPLQFSKRELDRVADRAKRLQDLFGMPLLHENAFYYDTFPDSTMSEAEFVSELTERAGTHLLLDLHNIHSNETNFPGYSARRFVETIPLNRVIEIHLAGGQWFDGWYHDLHNNRVPEPVWELLDWVLPRAENLRAVCLEVQGPSHNQKSREVDASWARMIDTDLDRARAAWTAHKGAFG
jgi:uncharacterized protein